VDRSAAVTGSGVVVLEVPVVGRSAGFDSRCVRWMVRFFPGSSPGKARGPGGARSPATDVTERGHQVRGRDPGDANRVVPAGGHGLRDVDGLDLQAAGERQRGDHRRVAANLSVPEEAACPLRPDGPFDDGALTRLASIGTLDGFQTPE
jgi:hypothetical protein